MMFRIPQLTTEGGAPVADDQRSQTAGSDGPALLQDHLLIEKLARFNRERIPERVVHAVGSGAYGYFEALNDGISRFTRMRLLEKRGKRTPVFVRFSTSMGSRGAADTAREARGFAVKFYTEDGNWDLVGSNSPIFSLRDGIKFPDFVHSQKPDPFTNRQEPDNIWDFFSRAPEATHQFTWLFGDRGIPASFRYMDGFGSHAYQWTNAAGERFWVKFHLKTAQGIRFLTSEEAASIAGRNPVHHQKDLYDAIEGGDFPSWTLKVQVMPENEAATYPFNPFDVTKVWPYRDYPLVPVGALVLDWAPDNFFAEVEQAAFDPANFVPGIGPSPDRVLQARLFAYGDAQRYRLGVNHTRLPVNEPKGVLGGARNYGRDGAMRFDDNGGRTKNYTPNSANGPGPSGAAHEQGLPLSGTTGPQDPSRYPADDDFMQAGALYRAMSEDARWRLIANLAKSLCQATRSEVRERSIGYFRSADSEYGARLEDAVRALRGGMR
ncbi:MAG TPA: catalase [Myxococcales bacterium]|nr:catalase [Myxococcales bacterium]